MRTRCVRRGNKTVELGMPAIDLDQMTDVLWGEMHGRVERPVIRQALEDSLSSYGDVHVWTFVPILMRRNVLEKFQTE
jgi:hypothetical protein